MVSVTPAWGLWWTRLIGEEEVMLVMEEEERVVVTLEEALTAEEEEGMEEAVLVEMTWKVTCMLLLVSQWVGEGVAHWV
ncbi:hypothetical protein E2C01_010544 [Portunus trituberculatus]|uniref:Uncharacterized protein n=1 Tax=Portunus trituberculatus TaxID=210409 RepID=A0A5B7D8N1_PORTR|nr:hypothetical protein [Portunus trituberculatus]